MALVPGTRLGVYEVAAQIGEGSMGQVYRATDTKLKRPVAIKILPPALAADAEQLARFRREAEVLASLNHPHIAAIYGLEESGDMTALVMELVEGENLSERIARGPIPIDEALPIANQIAEALEAAHEQGIVHRDLKPTNIRVRPDGTVKVLDFGLAKPIEPPAGSSPSMSMSPTVTTRAMTQAGLILGSVAYMSPEQARGKNVDRRTDVWAFGCVLYEMLTGQRAFGGDDVSETLARVIEREPAWDALPPAVPSHVRQTLRLCLRKPVRERLPGMGAARLALQGAFETTAPSSAAPGGRPGMKTLAAALLAAAALALGVVVGGRYLSKAVLPAPIVRFEVQPPADATLAPAPIASAAQLALSPDGRRLVFVAARRRGVSQLWVRPLDGVEAQPLPGTDGASFPFWSPDGQSLAFFAAGKLKTIDTAGGSPRVLCDAATGRGGSWNTDGQIAFAGSINGPLSLVAASGGVVTPLTALDPAQGALSHYFPQFLPDGRHFFYYQRSTKPEHAGVYVGTLGSSGATRIHGTPSMALYSSGFLWFSQGGTLFAQPFDIPALRTTGEPIRVAEGIGYYQAIGYAGVTVSGTGVIAHGPAVVLTTSVQRRDRNGATEGTLTPPGMYRSPRLSPDQKSLAMGLVEYGGSPATDVWVRDVVRGTMSRVTTDPQTDWFPVWLPDSRRLFFGSTRLGSTTVFKKTLGENEELFAETALFSGATAYPLDVSDDERFLVIHAGNPRGYDLDVLNLTGERKASVFLSTPFNEVQGRFSPNSRWMAYASDESGRFEVYVRPFPAASGQTQISIAGGMQPEWRRDGKELFYISADGKLTAVPVTTDGDTFSAGTPHALFDVDVPEPNAPYPNDYAVTADGQRFFVNTIVDQPTRPALTVILNWTAENRK